MPYITRDDPFRIFVMANVQLRKRDPFYCVHFRSEKYINLAIDKV